MSKFKKVLKEINKHKNFLVTSHINPEGDSIGSQLAFLYLLKVMGKNARILNSQKPGPRYKFLPNSKKILTKINKGIRYDAICFLDCADMKRIGRIYEVIDLSKPKINIDHHLSNTRFGNVNLIDSHASSTAEILYMLFKEAKVKINKETAICLYTAILTDTGSFNYSNVTSFTHKVVSCLIDAGVDTNNIYKKVYEEIFPSAMRLLGSALSTLKLSPDKRIAWIQITKDMLKKCGAGLADQEDFINFPRSIKGVKIAILFTEIAPKKIKVSLRSNDIIDVNEIASHFGGGGHQKASGCTIKGSLCEAKKKVLSEIRKNIE